MPDKGSSVGAPPMALSVPELLRVIARISRLVRACRRDRENWIKSENVD
jgi:hypothetical protein